MGSVHYYTKLLKCGHFDRDPYLLTRPDEQIKAFARQPDNHDAHLRGLEAEYRYLQATIKRVLNQEINIGALVRANTQRFGDWDDLFETNLPFFEPSEEEVTQAQSLLAHLRQLKRS